MPLQSDLACSEMLEPENDKRKQVLFAKSALPRSSVAKSKWGAYPFRPITWNSNGSVREADSELQFRAAEPSLAVHPVPLCEKQE
jgi:hypothetical protein